MTDILNFEERFHTRRQREIERTHVSATFLGLTVFPAFTLLDWVTQRDHFAELSIVRFGTTFIFLIAHLLARRGICPGGVTTTSCFLLILSAASITAMCVLTGGFASPYYAGISLVILTSVTYPPGTLRATTAAVAGMIAVYLLGLFFFENRIPAELDELFNNLVFIGATAFIGLTTAGLNDRLRRDAYRRLLDAEDAESVRRALGARDEFISIASHELCTPVTSMKLQNDLIKSELTRFKASDLAQNPKQYDRLRQWVTRNDAQLSRLTRLIEDMLDVSRINTGRMRYAPERLDLGDIVGEAIERFSGSFRNAGIDVRTTIAKGIMGSWDQLRLEQVLLNVFSNAVKYASGTRLDVRVEARGARGIIRVSDRGPGIAAENRERVFERFERAHSANGITGLGLGLYIARKIVEGHGGTIRIEENEGGGTTFVISLPLSRPPRNPVVRNVGEESISPGLVPPA